MAPLAPPGSDAYDVITIKLMGINCSYLLEITCESSMLQGFYVIIKINGTYMKFYFSMHTVRIHTCTHVSSSAHIYYNHLLSRFLHVRLCVDKSKAMNVGEGKCLNSYFNSRELLSFL